MFISNWKLIRSSNMIYEVGSIRKYYSDGLSLVHQIKLKVRITLDNL